MTLLPWLAVAVAAVLAKVWLDTSRVIIRLRGEFVRLHPVTGEPVEWPDGVQRLQETGLVWELPVGDRVERIRYLGAMVRRWDRLSPAEQRRLAIRRVVAGLGTVLFAVLGLLGLLTFGRGAEG